MDFSGLYSIDFNKLNKIIKEELNDKEVQPSLYYLEQLVKLSEIILENTPEVDTKKYSTKIPLNTSIQIATDFFNTINPRYSQMFQNILRHEKITEDKKENYAVKFYKVSAPKRVRYEVGSNGLVRGEESATFVNESGTVFLSYNELLDDVFTFVHEMTHKFSSPKDQFYMIKQFLGEVPTISMEVLLTDYLLYNTEYNKDEILIYWRNRLFFNGLENASVVIFEHILLNLYKENNNHLDSKIMMRYFESMDKDSKIYRWITSDYYANLEAIIKKNSLRFHVHYRYVIGNLLACYIHCKIKEEPKNISKLSYLIDILGNTNISTNRDLKILSKLDIPIIHNGQISVEENDIIRLTNSYKKEILDLIDNQNFKKNHQNEVIKERKENKKTLIYNKMKALFLRRKNILNDYKKYDTENDDIINKTK